MNADAVPVLVVEDDRELAMMLEVLLTDEGYRVDWARDGQRALHWGLTRSYDVVVLDRGLPAVEGLDLLGRWRRQGMETPVLVLSARGNPADRVEGLDAGAEDYLSKPFDVAELLARLRALLRRHRDTAQVLPVPGGVLDLDVREVRAGADRVALSERECALLAALATAPGRVLTREELRRTVFEDAGPEVVESYVHYLRRKLGAQVISTVRGRGYRLGSSR